MGTISLPNNTKKKNKRTAHHHGWRNILVLLSSRTTKEKLLKIHTSLLLRSQEPEYAFLNMKG
jgi:hypothetical protein